MDNLIQHFIDMCEVQELSDNHLISLRTVDPVEGSVTVTMSFATFKKDFNQYKIY